MTESNTSPLSRMMARIQALLVQADHPNTGEVEAATFRAKAEELMRKYRIEEEELIAQAPEASTPLHHRIWLGVTRSSDRGAQRADGSTLKTKSTFYQEWYGLMWSACNHAGVELHNTWGRNPETGEHGLFAELVGYEMDLRLAEMLYTSARIIFSEKVEPRVDPSLSDEENVYRLRSAGITRRRVAQMLWSLDTSASHAKVAQIYKAECARRGEAAALDGRGISAEDYRQAYARAFTDRFASRLREARDAADSAGGVMVLAGRAERVREALWTIFPYLRPSNAPAKPEKALKPRKPRKMSDAQVRKAFNTATLAGLSAGRVAADTVEIARPDPAKRVEPVRQPVAEL